MRATQASKTASWVAAARSFGRYLPEDCRLCDDPYGVRFADPWLQRIDRAFQKHPKLAEQILLRGKAGTTTVFYMQLRTRLIDDAVRAFAERGGRQIVLLGAGFDSRAVRLGRELTDLTFYEVDHPATQAIKKERLPELAAAPVQFVSWNFEENPMRELPAALAALGHDARQPSLTIWEGVTMYLQPAAIEATVATVASYSAVRSLLVFTYFDRASIERPTARARAVAKLVASVGEPFVFGWSPAALPGWLAERSFSLRRDIEALDLATELLPTSQQHWVARDGRHFAIAERVAAAL